MEDKPTEWIGSSLDDLSGFPLEVKKTLGYAIREAQKGGKHATTKPLRGFGGASVLEVVEEDDGIAYRAVYTVKFPKAVYVLHAFEKKSTKGIATPKHHIDLVHARLKVAEQHYNQKYKDETHDSK